MRTTYLVLGAGALALMACKPGGSASRPAAADARDGRYASVADGTPLTCDCAKLLPLDARPEWPRVTGGGAGGGRASPCVYAPGGSGTGDGALEVTVLKGESRAVYDQQARALVEAPAKHASVGGDAVAAYVATGAGPALLGVARLQAAGLVARTEAGAGEGSRGAPAELPAYLTVLATTAGAACR